MPFPPNETENLEQAEPQRQATRLVLTGPGTSSPARTWRPDVVAQLARTLNFTFRPSIL